MKNILKFFESLKYIIKKNYINSKLEKKNNLEVSNDNFYIVLDLMSFRCTWDIIGFLILAKIECKSSNPTIIVLPNINFDIDNQSPKEKSWMKNNSKNIRFDNIIKPCFELLENFNPNIIYLNNRKLNDFINIYNDNIFPKNLEKNEIIEWDYGIYKKINNKFNLSKNIPSLKAPLHYEVIVDQYIKKNANNKKIITITLRDSSFSEQKNSNISEWLKVYKKLKKDGYYVIFLDDFENTSINNHKSELVKENIYHYANIDPRVRLALYERAFVNLTVNNGTGQLLNYSKYTNFLMFKHYVNDVTSSSSLENNLKSLGLDGKKNEQYPFHNKCQKIIWDPDDCYETIISEFEKIKLDII